MKILFLGRRYLYFRNFDSVLRELAARGHAIHLAVEKEDEDGRPLVQALTAEFPNITCGEVPTPAEGDWDWIGSRLRLGLDYLRYQHPLFDDTPMLRERSRERTPGLFVRLGDLVRGRGRRWLRRPAAALLRRLERAVPQDAAIREFIDAHRPDVVLITPLIGLGSSQIEYLRAARAAGIRTALCVWSWDHLSSKALIRELPDRILVWNETQKREAVQLHGVPPSRVVVTGAQCFDKWFERKPSRDRETFCRQLGLPADRPYLLYVCSAPFLGSPPEAPFVADWVRRIRASAFQTLRSVPILVRPHPSRVKEWEQVDMRDVGDVVVWGGNPVDAQSRNDYFDSLYHSVAVAGLNTSAFIEAGIIGRPVHTILLPEWHENQLGTLHFRYLFEAGGGLLQSARSFDDHFAQLEGAIAHPSTEIRPFVRTFVRPHGLDVAATPLFVGAVEQLAEVRPTPPRHDALLPLSRRLLQRAIALRGVEAHERLLYSERELEGIVKLRGSRTIKEQRRLALKQQRLQEKEQRLDARRRTMEAHRAAKTARDAARKEQRQREREAAAAEEAKVPTPRA